jgi:AraC-like DNA-binding protein
MKLTKTETQKRGAEKTLYQRQSLLLALDDLDVHLLCAQRDHLPPGWWRHPRLTNDHWRLYQNDAGGGWLSTSDGALRLEGGEVYLIPPGITLSSDNDATLRQFFIHFDLRGLPPIVFQEMFPGPTLIPSMALLRESAFDLGLRVEKTGAGDFGIQCLLKGLVYTAFGRYFDSMSDDMLERCCVRVAALEPVLPALEYIHKQIGQAIAIETLAALCSMSESYFIRRFRMAVGITPAKYVIKRRIAHAAQRLLFTEDTIDRIAEELGFGDRFYFTRVFAQETGRPPAAYRRGARA